MAQNSKPPVMVLQELTIKNGYAPPDYNIVFQISGSHENRFDFLVKVAGIEATGSGSSKQIGKHQAAHNALLQLKELGIYKPSENPVAAFKVPLNNESNRENNTTYQSALNCIVELQNVCMENKINAPQFVEISSVGPPHSKEFTYECRISSITTEAKSGTKKTARQLAAKEMLSRIKQVLPDLVLEEKNSHKRLTDTSSEAVAKYQALRDIIPDKTVKVEDIPKAIAKLMLFKDLKYEDFLEDLKTPTEESLKKILDTLEVGYILKQFQETPTIAVLIIKIDTPFTVLAIGKSYEEAETKVLKETFKFLDIFMQIKV